MKNPHTRPSKSWSTVLSAFLFTAATLGLGFISFGWITTGIFASGFLGGFVLWLIAPQGTDYASIRFPYILTFILFIAHRVEEKVAGFFNELSRITGAVTPEILSWNVILLVVASVGAWCAIPWLLKRGQPFGCYLAWTFFSAMGITELAHFVFPLFDDRPYGYFPGMASVVALAPASWWGIVRLWSSPPTPQGIRR